MAHYSLRLLTLALLVIPATLLYGQIPDVTRDIAPGQFLDAPSLAPTLYSFPEPSPLPDVLNPKNRSNSPDIKIGLRAGVNRSAYSNDRYLDNSPLDVGQTDGELDIYTTAAGFGYLFGFDLEIPTSPGFSWLISAEYNYVVFAALGPVVEPCIRSDGSQAVGNSVHEFTAKINYLKFAGAMKLNFSGWYLLAGLGAEHPIRSSLERTRQLTEPNCFYDSTHSSDPVVELGEIPSTRPLHYVIRLGAGINYRLNDRLVFAPELVLDFGSSAINKSPNSDLGVYSISATLRYDLR